MNPLHSVTLSEQPAVIEEGGPAPVLTVGIRSRRRPGQCVSEHSLLHVEASPQGVQDPWRVLETSSKC